MNVQPTETETDLTTAVRLYTEDLPALDAILEVILKDNPRARRSDAVRLLLRQYAATGTEGR